MRYFYFLQNDIKQIKTPIRTCNTALYYSPFPYTRTTKRFYFFVYSSDVSRTVASLLSVAIGLSLRDLAARNVFQSGSSGPTWPVGSGWRCGRPNPRLRTLRIGERAWPGVTKRYSRGGRSATTSPTRPCTRGRRWRPSGGPTKKRPRPRATFWAIDAIAVSIGLHADDPVSDRLILLSLFRPYCTRLQRHISLSYYYHNSFTLLLLL